MTTPACCDAGPAKSATSVGTGREMTLGSGSDAELKCYVTGDAKVASNAVIVFYDIFGFSIENTRVFCDTIAAAGYYVVMPDFFRGDPWYLSNFPPQDRQAFNAFLERANKATPGDIDTVKAHFKEVGFGDKKYGAIGFCWGGLWSMRVAGDADFGAAASAHPAFIDEELARKVQCPMLLCPTDHDVDCEPFMKIFNEKGFGDKCVHKRFNDQVHGFCAARGDWSDPKVKSAAEDVMNMTINLFNQCIRA